MQTIEELFQAIRAFQESRAILTAVELDVFTAVAAEGETAAVARRIGADPRATGLLLDALAAMGLLTKKAGKYRNTDFAARALTAGADDDVRGAIGHFLSLWETWSTLTGAVRAGTSVADRPADPEQAAARTRAFIAAMHRFAGERAAALVDALGTTPVRKVLDLGGGSGANSIAIARAHGGAEAVILDLEPVTALAREYVADAGLSARIRTTAGDMLAAEYGSGYDLVVISQICHMFSPDENRLVFKKTADSLAPGGRIAIVDFVVDEERTSPRPGVVFALNMLVGTRAGSTYTQSEYARWLAEAGFVDPSEHPLHGQGPATLIVARRP